MRDTYHHSMSINPNKTKSIKNLGAIDITQLKLYVDKLSDKVWESETKSRENDFPCFHHTEHIIFRFPDQLTDRTIVHSNPIWPIWKPLLLPVMKQAVHPYGYSWLDSKLDLPLIYIETVLHHTTSFIKFTSPFKLIRM